jgi:hypothetical protein
MGLFASTMSDFRGRSGMESTAKLCSADFDAHPNEKCKKNLNLHMLAVARRL